MRKILINNKEYEIGLSFYRTYGSVNQQYIEVSNEDISNEDSSLFTGRIFHYVTCVNSGKLYFIKEYHTDKYMAFEEYQVSNLFPDHNNVMNILEVDDGKLLCEFVYGVQFSRLGTVIINHILPTVIELVSFIEMFRKKKIDHLIELNLNNTMLLFDESEQRYRFKIIDLETDPKRYDEFRVKNYEFLKILKKLKKDCKRDRH